MFHQLYDKRVNCISVLTEMTLGNYLELVDAVYKETGGIDGQRGPLRTKTAITIRTRLVEDIQAGAVMPPVVLGVLVSHSKREEIKKIDSIKHFLSAISDNQSENISIIDGMQRTTAMLDAVKQNPNVLNSPIRVEFWISDTVNSLIYRMLVLNTGQVPWEISRQLETVYRQFLREISDRLGDNAEIFFKDEQRRRVQVGQYQSKNVIELLLLFSSRKSELDIKDKVAEDFARLDAIETTAHSEFLEHFIMTLRLLTILDKEFSRLEFKDEDGNTHYGRNIFSRFPAMAGFCAAVSIEVFDEPGFDIEWESVPDKVKSIEIAVKYLVNKLERMNESELEEFIQLRLLNERLSQRSTQVGRFEREFFKKAFISMLRNSKRLHNMAPCWRA